MGCTCATYSPSKLNSRSIWSLLGRAVGNHSALGWGLSSAREWELGGAGGPVGKLATREIPSHSNMPLAATCAGPMLTERQDTRALCRANVDPVVLMGMAQRHGMLVRIKRLELWTCQSKDVGGSKSKGMKKMGRRQGLKLYKDNDRAAGFSHATRD